MLKGPNNKLLRKVILASSAGTMIEWYDFYIFGSLATILSTQFFPKENPAAAFLFTLAAFGVGFVIRPFGAIVFGRLGDMIGRKYTFLVTLLLMGGSTFAIGLIPGYETIGVFAPVIVFLLRAVQGLALGGEYGGAAIYVAEHAPAGRKGFFTSFIQTTATLGLFISLAVILSCKALMSANDFTAWGWRIPFLVSIFLVIVSYYIRKRMEESPVFTELKVQGRVSKNPLRESFGNKANLRLVLLALFGATAGQGVVWYTGQFYAMNFCIKNLNIDAAQVQWLLIPVLLIGTPLFIFFASLSDRVGRKWIMLTGIGLAALSYYPVYKGMAAQAQPSGWGATGWGDEQRQANAAGDSTSVLTLKYPNGAKQVIKTETTKAKDFKDVKKTSTLYLPASNLFNIGLLIFLQLVFVAMAYGPIAAFLVELFPVHIRYTSLSLPYHIGNGVFGGLTPLIAESLVQRTGNIFAGLWYPIAIAAITALIGIFFLKSKYAGDGDRAVEAGK
ncbi:MAG TPA: MFS transporter [Bacteroidia bacterium]